MSKKPNLPIDIPMEFVMAFNAVSAPAFVGTCAALSLDKELDGEPNIEVIVMAKDPAMLQRFFSELPHSLDLNRTYPVALAHQKHLRLAWASGLRYSSFGSYGNPEPGQPTGKDEEL